MPPRHPKAFLTYLQFDYVLAFKLCIIRYGDNQIIFIFILLEKMHALKNSSSPYFPMRNWKILCYACSFKSNCCCVLCTFWEIKCLQGFLVLTESTTPPRNPSVDLPSLAPHILEHRLWREETAEFGSPGLALLCLFVSQSSEEATLPLATFSYWLLF